MIVLFVAYHVHHLVERTVTVAQLHRTQVLGHIHRRAVGAQHQLLVQSFVSQIDPHRTVLFAKEYPLR